MKIVRFTHGDTAQEGVLDGEQVRTDLATYDLADVSMLPPVAPGKIVCVGLNYRDHAEEAGAPLPSLPLLFAKLGNTITAHGEPIPIPGFTTQVDYEAELGVVIGRTCSRVAESEALAAVRGYTCVNDVSARDLQFADGQWTRGKSLDGFCPVGPWLVTPDEVPDPQAIGIRCLVNGETLQDSSTKHMIFGVAELISFISQGITLEPGDLIATGTPAGVGFVRTPPVFLQPGDSVTVSIEQIGDLTNPVVRA